MVFFAREAVWNLEITFSQQSLTFKTTFLRLQILFEIPHFSTTIAWPSEAMLQSTGGGVGGVWGLQGNLIYREWKINLDDIVRIMISASYVMWLSVQIFLKFIFFSLWKTVHVHFRKFGK